MFAYNYGDNLKSNKRKAEMFGLGMPRIGDDIGVNRTITIKVRDQLLPNFIFIVGHKSEMTVKII